MLLTQPWYSGRYDQVSLVHPPDQAPVWLRDGTGLTVASAGGRGQGFPVASWRDGRETPDPTGSASCRPGQPRQILTYVTASLSVSPT